MSSDSGRKIPMKLLLLYCTVAVSALLLLLLALIASLPAIVSTPRGQTFLRQSLTNSLKRPLHWSRLSLSWTEGLTVGGLSFGDGPPPLLRGGIDEVVILPVISRGEQGRFKVDLTLRLRAVTAELAPGPPKPAKPYAEPLTSLAAALQNFDRLDWPLPVDVAARVDISPLRLIYRDPATGRQLALTDFSLRGRMPSLSGLPLTLELGGGLAVDRQAEQRLRLKAEISSLVTAARRIHPAGATIALEALFPGTTLQLSGGLHQPQGLAAAARLDLAELFTAVRPLLKPAAVTASGRLTLKLQAGSNAARDLQADLDISGAALALSGGRLKGGRVAPLDLRLRQKVATDHQRQLVTFSDGSLAVPGLLDAAWRATVERPDRRDRSLQAELGPVKVDLQRSLALAGPLLSPGFPLKEIGGALTVRRLTAELNGRQNRGAASLQGAVVTMPRLRLALAKGEVTAGGVELAIDRAALPLAALKPTQFDADLSYGVEKVAISGSRPVTAERLRGALRLGLRDLVLKSDSPRRFTAAIELSEKLDLGRLQLEKRLALADLHQELQLSARANDSGEITADLRELKVAVRSLQAAAAGRQLPPFALTAALKAADIRLPAVKGEMPTLAKAEVELAAGDFLQLSARAGYPAAGPRLAVTAGRARVDLDRLLPLAAPFLPKGAAAGGTAALSWELAAPLAAASLPQETKPLRRVKAFAALIDHGEVALTLDSRSVTVPRQKGSIALGSLRTVSPLRLMLADRGASVRLEGRVEATELAGLTGQLPPQSASLLISGELTSWQTLRLKEELRLQTLGFSQSAEATLSRLDAVMAGTGKLTAATLLQQLDADLSTRLTAGFAGRPLPSGNGAEISGSCAAAASVKLTAGKELRLHATIESRELGARLQNGTSIDGVNAALRLDRTYALAKGLSPAWRPLSLSLLRPLPEAATAAAEMDISSRVREDLRGQGGGSSKFTVRRIVTGKRDSPLELTRLEGELLLTPEQAGLSFLQTEVLGGTLRASGLIDLRPELPTVAAASSFSNLQTALLLPPELRSKHGSSDTALSGEASFEAPLATRERELLEGLRLRLSLRRIGADTLERALFGLDPYERNEQLVAQRKMLRHGSLKRLSATALDGAFSLEGAVEVRGVIVELPRVERIRLAEMSMRKEITRVAAGVARLRGLLELLRADALLIGPKGEIALGRRPHEE